MLGESREHSAVETKIQTTVCGQLRQPTSKESPGNRPSFGVDPEGLVASGPSLTSCDSELLLVLKNFFSPSSVDVRKPSRRTG